MALAPDKSPRSALPASAAMAAPVMDVAQPVSVGVGSNGNGILRLVVQGDGQRSCFESEAANLPSVRCSIFTPPSAVTVDIASGWLDNANG